MPNTSDNDALLERAPRDEAWKAHLAIVLVQSLYAGGATVRRLGLLFTNPVAYTVWRVLLAGPVLATVQASKEGFFWPARHEVQPLIVCGVCMVTMYLGMTVGLMLIGAIMESLWQPTTLIFTAVFSMFVYRTEEPTPRRLLGVLMGLCGAVCLVVGDPAARQVLFPTEEAQVTKANVQQLVGHSLLFLGVLTAGFYSVYRTWMLKIGLCGGSPLRLVTWAHLIAGPIAAVLAGGLSLHEGSRDVVCGGCASLLYPPAEWKPRLAIVFDAGMAAFTQTAMAWASTLVAPSTVGMYFALQPVVSATTVMVLRAAFPNLAWAMPEPGANLIGGLPIILGLWLVAAPPPVCSAGSNESSHPARRSYGSASSTESLHSSSRRSHRIT